MVGHSWHHWSTTEVASGTDYRPGTVTAPPEVAISTSPDGPAYLRRGSGLAGVPPELSAGVAGPDDVSGGGHQRRAGPAASPWSCSTSRYFQGEPAVVIWLGDWRRHPLGPRRRPCLRSEHAGADTRYQHRIS